MISESRETDDPYNFPITAQGAAGRSAEWALAQLPESGSSGDRETEAGAGLLREAPGSLRAAAAARPGAGAARARGDARGCQGPGHCLFPRQAGHLARRGPAEPRFSAGRGSSRSPKEVERRDPKEPNRP